VIFSFSGKFYLLSQLLDFAGAFHFSTHARVMDMLNGERFITNDNGETVVTKAMFDNFASGDDLVFVISFHIGMIT